MIVESGYESRNDPENGIYVENTFVKSNIALV